MMELSCIIVLCFATLVTPTPYGYGVKGGASAKAEANAAAGAFAGLPLSIPSGPGISGSFSKSSSSSFASSSASSSSSSSSFSFNGLGANNLGVNGGCSGGCSNKGSFDATPTSSGTFDSNYKSDNNNGGNTAADTTGQDISNIPSYTKNIHQPCEGAGCNVYGGNPKCNSGQCLTSHSFKNDDDKDDDNDSKEEESFSKQKDTENETDDIKINVARNSGHDDTSNIEGSIRDDESTNGCHNGHCYPAVSQTVQPTNAYGSNNVRIPIPTSGVAVTPKCHTPNCDPYNPTPQSQGTAAPSYNKPSQHLSTPNYGPVCATYPCHSSPSDINNDNRQSPTNYNVPIFVVSRPSPILQNNNTPCLSGPCLNNDQSNNLRNIPSASPPYGVPPGSKSPVTCTSGTCNVVSNAPINTGRVTNPSYSTTGYSHGINSGQYPIQPSASSACQGSNCNQPNFGIIGNHSPQNIPSNCGTGSLPGCNYKPDAVSGQGNKPGHLTDLPKLGYTVAPNIQPEHPGYKTPPQNINTQQGFPGLVKGPEIHNPDDYTLNSNTPSIPSNGLVPPTISYPTNSGNYGNPNLPNSNVRPGYSSKPVYSPEPNTGIPHSVANVPTHTSAFGAPTNVNGFHNPNNPGSYGPQSGAPNYGSYTPSGAVEYSKPNSFGTSGQYHPTHVTVPSGGSTFLPASPKPGGTNIPRPFEEKEKLPYTGGFGGPSGLLKPNEYNLPSKIPLSPVNHKTDSCSSGDCSPKLYKTTDGGQSAISNSATASASTSAKAIPYTGGFGGPPGFLKPNDDEKPLHFIPLNGKGSQDTERGAQIGHSADNIGNGNREISRGEGDGSISHNNANAVAQASAIATAQAGALSNNDQGSKGCSLCTVPNGANGNYGSSSGLTNAGTDGDANNAGAVAAAKSVANAGAGSYGLGGSFASSSASAHASAGVPRKGGYGRR